MNEYEIGETCGMHGGEKKWIQVFQWENMRKNSGQMDGKCEIGS